ncbi:MAG: MFS transporter, partial [Actinobacteria bacterium]|nr:MFS transporter [Actinomycetota bacterium]
MASSSEPGLGSLLRAAGFRRLLIGQAVSGLGDWVATLALIAFAFQLSNRSQTAVAVVLVIRLVPPIFAAPVGGLLADRLDRRVMMVSCDILRGGLICLIPIFHTIAVLYVIAFVHECISLFFLPARDASVPELAPEGTLPLANGLMLASSFGSIPFAAALFSALRFAAGHVPDWLPFAELARSHPQALAFFFDAATFMVSAAMISRVQIPRHEEGAALHLFSGLAEASRFAWRNPLLRSLGEGLLVSMFGGGVLFAIGIAYIHQTLGGSDIDFGWLAALWGAGMGIGLAAVRFLIRERGASIVVLAGVVGCGGVLIVMSLLPYLWLSFIVAVVFGAAFSIAITVALSIAQQVTEDRLRGRIMGGVQMLFRVGLGAGALGMGGLANAIDVIHPGIGGIDVRMDGNQVGMFAGGVIILAGALA